MRNDWKMITDIPTDKWATLLKFKYLTIKIIQIFFGVIEMSDLLRVDCEVQKLEMGMIDQLTKRMYLFNDVNQHIQGGKQICFCETKSHEELS